MLNFYKKATLIFLCLVAALTALGVICYNASWLRIELLPLHTSDIDWLPETGISTQASEPSTSKIVKTAEELDFEYRFQSDAQNPIEHFGLSFRAEKKEDAVDLSRFSHLHLHIKCQPESILSLSLSAGSDTPANGEDGNTYKIPTTYFACFQDWQVVRLNIENFQTPLWLRTNPGTELPDKRYTPKKIRGLQFGSVKQISPSTSQKLNLKSITFQGRNWIYIYVFSGVFVICLALYVGLFIYFYPGNATEQTKNNPPVKATADDPLQSHKLKEKINILVYLSSEYKNPDLNLDSLIHTLGINRTKVNNILKSETGQTFTAYLNKLRLTEAARLLLDNTDASVSEIAYSVGYNNASYFNRLFKKEYGCTPVSFRQSRGKKDA